MGVTYTPPVKGNQTVFVLLAESITGLLSTVSIHKTAEGAEKRRAKYALDYPDQSFSVREESVEP